MQVPKETNEWNSIFWMWIKSEEIAAFGFVCETVEFGYFVVCLTNLVFANRINV